MNVPSVFPPPAEAAPSLEDAGDAGDMTDEAVERLLAQAESEAAAFPAPEPEPMKTVDGQPVKADKDTPRKRPKPRKIDCDVCGTQFESRHPTSTCPECLNERLK